MIKITFPDGSVREFAKGTTAFQIAESISPRLAADSLAASVNGATVDMMRPIEEDASVKFYKWEDEEGKHAFWHTSSHLLAEALEALYPGIKFGIGPAIENGFYYDVDSPTPITEADLPKIEQKMQELSRNKEQLIRREVPKAEALKTFTEKGDQYKVELITDLQDGTISFYTNGAFTDLCRGPHIPNTGYIKALKLTSVAGAYWRGNEKNKMLTRIYGISFPKKSMLDEYLVMMEEAKKRDHRKLGKDLELFCFSQRVGQGLPLWLASYVVYNRHAEAKDIVRWETPADIDRFLLNFRPNELRNPIVELVVRETLRVVRDIWTRYGGFDEIHVELGREMKMPAKQRQKLSKRMLENERINLRIKMMLACFQNPEFKVDEVRPYSPYQQEILKIYEEYVLHDVKEIPDDITAIIKKFDKEEANEQPSVGEVLHYKEWLDKKYISPYTGEIIPLGRLLTHDYEIEHIIPQKRYFDDSLNNKVICESAVNNLKSAQLAHEFISQHHGEVVELGHGRTARILELEDYEKWVKEHYAALPRKRRNLLLDEVPEAFIARQLNDTRYISKYVSMLLSNIVRGEDERSVNSTHLIATNGSITTRLKQDWGINDVWNAIVLPRFERLNSMAQPEDGQLAQVYVTRNTQGHPIPTVPLDRQRGFSMKRIDHRHHAMDAIVIACASRNMVNYLNNESARKDAKVSRTDLQHLLCTKTRDANGKYRWVVNKPWLTFTTDVHHALEDIVASFKQNRRIMSPTVNYFDHYDPATGKKRRKKQTQGEMQAVRMSMHDATFYGEINLRSIKEVSLKQALEQPQRIVNKDLKHKLQTLQAEGLNLKQMTAYFAEHHDEWADVNVKKIAVYVYSKEEGKARYFASRTVLDQSFTRDYIERKVADTGIQQILLRHLVHYENAEQAFSPEGIEDMNKNLKELNNGRPHQPIYKVRTYTQGVKSAVGQRNCKAAQFVNGAKGTNLYFAVYEGTEGEVSESKRSFATFSLRDVLPCLKDGKPVIPEFDKKGKRLKFVLSPLDLVYVPTPEDLKLGQVQLPLNKKRIYKMVSCSDARCFWVPVNVASAIVDKYEFSSLNKMERAVTGEMIKEICLPLDMDRLGNVHLRQ